MDREDLEKLPANMPACATHRKYKKGECSACHCCRKCPAPGSCATPSLHIPSGSTRKPQSTTGLISQVTLGSTTNAEENSSAALKLLLTALGLPTNVCKVPPSGFPSKVWDCSKQARSRAKAACLQITTSLCKALCPSDPDGMKMFFHESLMSEKDGSQSKSLEQQVRDLTSERDTILLSLARVSLSASTEVSDYTRAFLIGCSTNCKSVHYLENAAQTLCRVSNDEDIVLYLRQAAKNSKELRPEVLSLQAGREMFKSIVKGKSICGHSQFTRCKKAFGQMLQGGEFPEKNYRFRVSEEKYITAISFLQSSLSLKQGQSRSGRVGAKIVENIRLLNRERYSLKNLFSQYQLACSSANRLGRLKFVDLVNLVSEKSAVRAGLSTYLVDILYTSRILDAILQRCLHLVCVVVDSASIRADLENTGSNLLLRWTDLFSFLKFQFAKNHISEEGSSVAHSSKYILGEAVSALLPNTPCKHCDEIFIFPTDCQKFFEKIEDLTEKEDIIFELDSMKRAMNILSFEIIRYAEHEVRGAHQEMDLLKVKEETRNDARQIVLVCDHKKKILPLFFREGQNQFFGKTGYSLLGIMAIYQGKIHFYDIVVEGYSNQDATQVQGLVCILKEIVKKDYPSVVNIVLQTDNASAFSSAEHIRTIFQLNERLKLLPIVQRWINTEAQKGKTKLDTHFSYVGKQFEKYVGSGRDMYSERTIVALVIIIVVFVVLVFVVLFLLPRILGDQGAPLVVRCMRRRLPRFGAGLILCLIVVFLVTPIGIEEIKVTCALWLVQWFPARIPMIPHVSGCVSKMSLSLVEFALSFLLRARGRRPLSSVYRKVQM